MRCIALVLLVASAAFGQTQSKPAAPASKSGSTTAQSSAKTGAAAASRGAAQNTAARKPSSEMPVLHGFVKPMFTERYEEIKIGTGALAEPSKLYHVQYTGYLATTGQKFDSSADHRAPVMKDGKPVVGADGKPELGEPQPMIFPQGMGRLIAGFDQGFAGMHIGGKRRIFIPWQLAYGTRDIPAREGHIGIPPKSDLIFDVELLDVTDIPAMPRQPGGGVPHPPAPNPNATPGASGAQPATPPATTQPSTPPAASAPATPPPAAAAPSGSAPAAQPQTK